MGVPVKVTVTIRLIYVPFPRYSELVGQKYR